MEKQNTKTNQTKILRGSRGITLIALVITIVLNCWRSGRNKVNNPKF